MAGGFATIPTAVCWAIVTMTTVGYGDITPHTPLGRALAAVKSLDQILGMRSVLLIISDPDRTKASTSGCRSHRPIVHTMP
jgi:voltage-gated potassium channel Kch